MARRRKRGRKLLKWLLFLILLVVAGVVCFLVWQSYFSGNGNENEDKVVKTEEIEEKEENKIEDKKSEEGKDKNGEVEKVVQYEGENPNKKEDLTGVVTYTGVNDGVLMVRVNIDQYISSGECDLVLMRDGADVYSAVVDIIASVATSTCDGFDIPVSSVGNGFYNIVIGLNSGDKVGEIRGEVSI